MSSKTISLRIITILALREIKVTVNNSNLTAAICNEGSNPFQYYLNQNHKTLCNMSRRMLPPTV
jgi:hypothetical protein